MFMLKLTFFQLELNPGVWSWCGVGAPPNTTPLFLYSIQARRQTLSHFMSRQRGFFSHRSRKKLRLNETSNSILFILIQQHSFDALRHVCSLVWSFFRFFRNVAFVWECVDRGLRRHVHPFGLSAFWRSGTASTFHAVLNVVFPSEP